MAPTTAIRGRPEVARLLRHRELHSSAIYAGAQGRALAVRDAILAACAVGGDVEAAINAALAACVSHPPTSL